MKHNLPHHRLFVQMKTMKKAKKKSRDDNARMESSCIHSINRAKQRHSKWRCRWWWTLFMIACWIGVGYLLFLSITSPTDGNWKWRWSFSSRQHTHSQIFDDFSFEILLQTSIGFFLLIISIFGKRNINKLWIADKVKRMFYFFALTFNSRFIMCVSSI